MSLLPPPTSLGTLQSADSCIQVLKFPRDLSKTHWILNILRQILWLCTKNLCLHLSPNCSYDYLVLPTSSFFVYWFYIEPFPLFWIVFRGSLINLTETAQCRKRPCVSSSHARSNLFAPPGTCPTYLIQLVLDLFLGLWSYLVSSNEPIACFNNKFIYWCHIAIWFLYAQKLYKTIFIITHTTHTHTP